MKREASRTVQPSKDAESASSAPSAARPELHMPCRHPLNFLRTCRTRSRTPSNNQAPCFHIVARSFACRKTPTPAFSNDCALFDKNTGGGYPPLLTPNFPTRSALFARHYDAHSTTSIYPESAAADRRATVLNPPRGLVYHARRNKIPPTSERCVVYEKFAGWRLDTHFSEAINGRAVEDR